MKNYKRVVKDKVPLFIKDQRGKVRSFAITVFEDFNGTGAIVSTSGLLNGKKKDQVKRVLSGKNSGKSNATTALEQAQLEAQSMWESKRKEGYRSARDISNLTGWAFNPTESLSKYLDENLPKFPLDHLNRPKPMLAQKLKGTPKTPVYIQPKLNGIRGLAMSVDQNTDGLPIKSEPHYRFISRGGEAYTLDHLVHQVSILLDKVNTPIILDGELYVHGLPLEDINRKVRGYNMFDTDLTYVVYDAIFPDQLNIEQSERLELLESLPFEYCSSLFLLKTHLCETPEDVARIHKKNKEDGYEGSILRPLKGKYSPGFRTKALLKIKNTIDGHFEIVGATRKEGAPAKDFVWDCITADGKRFQVKPHGTESTRETMWSLRSNYIGKRVKLEFFEYTKEGIPFHITDVSFT